MSGGYGVKVWTPGVKRARWQAGFAREGEAASLARMTGYSKAQQLARGERRYRRKVASPKQWQAIIAAKRGPCRVCEVMVPHPFEGVEYHHLVARVHGGGDTADNIVPLCSEHHGDITARHAGTARILLAGLRARLRGVTG